MAGCGAPAEAPTGEIAAQQLNAAATGADNIRKLCTAVSKLLRSSPEFTRRLARAHSIFASGDLSDIWPDGMRQRPASELSKTDGIAVIHHLLQLAAGNELGYSRSSMTHAATSMDVSGVRTAVLRLILEIRGEEAFGSQLPQPARQRASEAPATAGPAAATPAAAMAAVTAGATSDALTPAAGNSAATCLSPAAAAHSSVAAPIQVRLPVTAAASRPAALRPAAASLSALSANLAVEPQQQLILGTLLAPPMSLPDQHLWPALSGRPAYFSSAVGEWLDTPQVVNVVLIAAANAATAGYPHLLCTTPERLEEALGSDMAALTRTRPRQLWCRLPTGSSPQCCPTRLQAPGWRRQI